MTSIEQPDEIVYALTNPSMAGLVKIGRTSRSAESRSSELFTTGVPTPFEVGLAYRVRNSMAVERALHVAFAPYREHASREFFRVELSQIAAVLNLLGMPETAEDVTAEAAMDPRLIPNERISPRPRADFQVMQIPLGAEIVFKRNGAVATIATRNSVSLEGEVMSLTTATRKLAPEGQGAGAFKLWTFNGEDLMRIYDRHYPRDR